jgi:magnesium chelatase family protein
VQAYQNRLSGPLLDRIDLHVEVPALAYAEVTGPPGEPSRSVAGRVAAARQRQADRSKATGALTNARLEPSAARRVAALDGEGDRLLATAAGRYRLSGRVVDRMLRVARTIADLEEHQSVVARDVAEALHFRRCGVDTPS